MCGALVGVCGESGRHERRCGAACSSKRQSTVALTAAEWAACFDADGRIADPTAVRIQCLRLRLRPVQSAVRSGRLRRVMRAGAHAAVLLGLRARDPRGSARHGLVPSRLCQRRLPAASCCPHVVFSARLCARPVQPAVPGLCMCLRTPLHAVDRAGCCGRRTGLVRNRVCRCARRCGGTSCGTTRGAQRAASAQQWRTSGVRSTAR